MTLECTCRDISGAKWETLMRGARPVNGRWLRFKIRKHLPELYRELLLDFPNPYEGQCKVTRTHYIYVHSLVEYFIRK